MFAAFEASSQALLFPVAAKVSASADNRSEAATPCKRQKIKHGLFERSVSVYCLF